MLATVLIAVGDVLHVRTEPAGDPGTIEYVPAARVAADTGLPPARLVGRRLVVELDQAGEPVRFSVAGTSAAA